MIKHPNYDIHCENVKEYIKQTNIVLEYDTNKIGYFNILDNSNNIIKIVYGKLENIINYALTIEKFNFYYPILEYKIEDITEEMADNRVRLIEEMCQLEQKLHNVKKSIIKI